MREYCNVAADRAGTGYHSVDSLTHLFGRLATRASIAEDEPARRDLVDLIGSQSLVFTVVPLNQVGVDDHLIAEARQFAGLGCALQGAEKNEGKFRLGEYRSHPLRKPAAVVGQRDVCRPRMLPGKAPHRLAVPYREHLPLPLRRTN